MPKIPNHQTKMMIRLNKRLSQPSALDSFVSKVP